MSKLYQEQWQNQEQNSYVFKKKIEMNKVTLAIFSVK